VTDCKEALGRWGGESRRPRVKHGLWNASPKPTGPAPLLQQPLATLHSCFLALGISESKALNHRQTAGTMLEYHP